jgi:hypothetical protein
MSAVWSNSEQINHTNAQQVVARILELRKGNMLPEGVSIRDLIHAGRP